MQDKIRVSVFSAELTKTRANNINKESNYKYIQNTKLNINIYSMKTLILNINKHFFFFFNLDTA